MTILLLMGMILVSKRLSELAVSGEVEEQKDVIVIDPGHGGTDPGKVISGNHDKRDRRFIRE